MNLVAVLSGKYLYQAHTRVSFLPSQAQAFLAPGYLSRNDATVSISPSCQDSWNLRSQIEQISIKLN